MNIPALKLQNVTYTYEMEDKLALDLELLTIASGEWVAIAGRSGSGKSTLAQILSGYLPRSGGGSRAGSVVVCGIDPASADIADMAQRIGIVFQDPDAQLVQGWVEDELAFGPENMRVPSSDILSRVEEALLDVDLVPQREQRIHDLSGGQRQRTAIAAVLCMQTPILLLDDVSSQLDTIGRNRVLSLLKKLHGEGRTIVTFSGRVDDMVLAAPRLIVMDQGQIVLDGVTSELLLKEQEALARCGVLAARTVQALNVTEHGVDKLGEISNGENVASQKSERFADIVIPSDDNIVVSPLLQVSHLTFGYGDQISVLRDVTAELMPGDWRLLCGDNGSGKSTLTKLLMGILPVPKGTVFWQGKDVSKMSLYKLAEQIGYVFQQPEHQFVTSSVLEEVLYGPRAEAALSRQSSTPDKLVEEAYQWLEMAGLAHKSNVSPYLLSGGEKRLLSIAAQFISPKALYILDEPTAGTDFAGMSALLQMCSNRIKQGSALLVVTHEPQLFVGHPVQTWSMLEGTLQ